MGALVLEYYYVLRSVLRTKAHLRGCLSRCRHCRIFFFTHPRNAGRKDLGCPFGCREAHRKQGSNRRSVEYYRGKEGWFKKRIQNGKRQTPQSPPCAEPSPKRDSPDCREDGDLQIGSTAWDWPMLEHVRMASSLIEGRRVSLEEVRQMLARVLRQHSMARRTKIDHLLWWLEQHPP